MFKRDSIIKLQQFIVIPWIQCNMLTYRASQNTLIQSMFIIVSVTMKLIYIKIQFTNVVHISSAFINRRVQFSNVVNISSAFINRRVQFSNVVNISSAFINRRVQFSNVVHISSAFINRRVQFSNVVHILSAFINRRVQFSNVHAYIVISITFCQFIIISKFRALAWNRDINKRVQGKIILTIYEIRTQIHQFCIQSSNVVNRINRKQFVDKNTAIQERVML